MSDIAPYNSNMPARMKLTDREKEVCDALATYNQLRAFKLDAIDILEWKDTILKLMPNVKPPAIQFVIEQMVAGNIEHKKDEGIQNIVRGLKIVVKRSGQWQIKDNGIKKYPTPW